MIRKRGKANWEYTCKPCNHTTKSPDQFRAIESMQRHTKTLSHLGGCIMEGFRPIVELFDAFTAPLTPMSGLDYIVPGCSPTLKSPSLTSLANRSSTLAPSKTKPKSASA